MSSAADVRVGLLLPTRERAVMEDWSAAPLLDLARRAERLGFDSVWAGDSLTARPRFDPLTLLAAVAASTESVTVGTAALTATLRHPLLAAQTLATLDQVAEGRLVVGLGAGFPYPASEAEFAAVGVPFEGRLKRLADTVEHWRRLWRGEAVDGFPRPTRPGGPPLWFAGAGPRGLALTGSVLDGWLPYLAQPDDYADARDTIQQAATKAGRDAAAVTSALYATVLVDEDADRAEHALEAYTQAYYGLPLAELGELQAFIWGSAADCARRLEAYVTAGASHLVLRIGSLTPEKHVDTVAAELVPRIRRKY